MHLFLSSKKIFIHNCNKGMEDAYVIFKYYRELQQIIIFNYEKV